MKERKLSLYLLRYLPQSNKKLTKTSQQEKSVCVFYALSISGRNGDQKYLNQSVFTPGLVESRNPEQRGTGGLDMVMHTCHPSTQEAEMEGSRVQGQPEGQSETLPQDKVKEIYKSMKVISQYSVEKIGSGCVCPKLLLLYTMVFFSL